MSTPAPTSNGASSAGAGHSVAALKRKKKKGKKRGLGAHPVTAAATSKVKRLRSNESVVEATGELPAPPAKHFSPVRYLEWLIAPLSLREFFDDYWEKKPLVIKRKDKDYYTHGHGVLTVDDIYTILQDNFLKFAVNVDVTQYREQQRYTLNPHEGRASCRLIAEHFRDGCSVRLLNPQSYHEPLWRISSSLQEYFGCMVGTNCYWTPAGTQGFAPHFDDIEAFLLQTEGAKRWRLYDNPAGQSLPTQSSPNFTDADLGDCKLEIVLEPGDLMYMPRGTVHQGVAMEDTHSLHVTVSTYQCNAWGHLLQKAVPAALQIAMEEDDEFRQGLPVDFLSYTGVVNSDVEDERRQQFVSTCKRLFAKLADFAPIDAAADQLGVDFINKCLPPLLSPKELAQSAHGRPAAGQPHAELTDKSRVKLVRPKIARLAVEGDVVVVYHAAGNSKVPEAEEAQSLEYTMAVAPALEFLLQATDKFVAIEGMPLEEAEDRVMVAKTLYDAGVLIIA